MQRIALAGLATLFFVAPLWACDWWWSRAPWRAVDPTGHWYVAVAGSPGMPRQVTRCELFERGPGAPPLEPASEPDPAWNGPRSGGSAAGPPGARDLTAESEGDRRVSECRLPHQPMVVHVLPAGAGFVAVDHYASLGSGPVVLVVGSDGVVRFELGLGELFEERQLERFRRTTGSTCWRRGSWVDAEANALVLVLAIDSGLVLVDLSTGAVEPGGVGWLARTLGCQASATQELALDLAREWDAVLPEAPLRALLEDEAHALGVRLRAALVLCDPRGSELFLAAARDPAAGDARWFAVRHLAEWLAPADALPVLRALAHGEQGPPRWAAQAGLAGLGDYVDVDVDAQRR